MLRAKCTIRSRTKQYTHTIKRTDTKRPVTPCMMSKLHTCLYSTVYVKYVSMSTFNMKENISFNISALNSKF